MLLDRIEIDNHGPLSRVEIGPLSHHLNVILGPVGSGKTAISRFIRDSLLERNYPTGMLSSSSGRVVWVGDHGWIHVRREQDGTPGGRRDVQFQSRGESMHVGEPYRDGWFDDLATYPSNEGKSFASRAVQNFQLPESIVDGVMVDTLVSNVSHVVASCLRAGLDRDGLAPLPLHNETALHRDSLQYSDSVGSHRELDEQLEHRRWRSELADVEARLAQLETTQWDTQTVEIEPESHAILARQREELLRQRQSCWQRRESILHRESLQRNMDRVGEFQSVYDGQWRADQDRLRSLHVHADSLRARAVELKRWIAELNHRADFGSEFAYRELNREVYSKVPRYESLELIDDEIISLRRALLEIAGIRDSLHRRTTRFPRDYSNDWLTQRRYNYFVAAIDHYRGDRPWEDFYQSAYQPLHEIDDVSMRIDAATRQIDELLHRLERMDGRCSAPENLTYDRRRESRLVNSLRQVRDRLTHQPTVTGHHLDACAAEMNATLEELISVRSTIVDCSDRSVVHENRVLDWTGQRNDAVARLSQVESELVAVLDETARLRRRMRYLPIADSEYAIGTETNEYRATAQERSYLADLDAQLRYLDDELRILSVRMQRRTTRRVHRSMVGSPMWNDLSRRRDELMHQLRSRRPVVRRESSLREMACAWLVRLSAGRHRQVQWTIGWSSAEDQRTVTVQVDGQDERSVSAATRAVASLAVRLAAGELLSRMGRSVPLVVETHRELLHAFGGSDARPRDVYQHWTSEGLSADSIASALCDYAAGSRQLLILSSDAALADWIVRGGGRLFRLTTQRIVHPHRPMWRSGSISDQYVGPHGLDSTLGLPRDAVRNTYASEHINAEFERAWVESAGLDGSYYSTVEPIAHRATFDDGDAWLRRHPAVSTDMPPAGTQYRDGVYYADQTTSVRPSEMIRSADVDSRTNVHGELGVATRPFFLTVDSPIDAAPSIDAVAAARLRRIGISHITHLMNQDSNRLSDTLGLAGVDASTIRRWQAECRLMCRVPQLRGFDARVLVGCGIGDPAQLAAIHPTGLLDRVKTFLATEAGQRMLLSGTSYELSRITSWIASANQTVHGTRRANDFTQEERRSRRRSQTVDGRPVRRSLERDDQPVTLYREADDGFDQQRYEVRSPRPSRQSGLNPKPGNADETVRQREPRPERPDRVRERQSAVRQTSVERGPRPDREFHKERQPSERMPSVQRERSERSSENALRFYLERASNVVDAPSIGPRMAERLNQIGIFTVNDLLTRNAESIANELGHRRVTAEVVQEWQQQATLVCRVPMMRGHDAQFLVAAGVQSVEQLAGTSAAALYPKIATLANSVEGRRISRGGQVPDLAEVQQWIGYATQNRPLQAA